MSQSMEERRRAVIKQLAQCLGPKASDYAEYIEFNWMDESVAHIGGGPGLIMPPGTMHNFHYLRRPHGDHVYFGGSETAVSWAGFMSGAIEAGWRAAAEAMEKLHPDRLNDDDRRLLGKSRAMGGAAGKAERRGEMLRRNRRHGSDGGLSAGSKTLMAIGAAGIAAACWAQRDRIGDLVSKVWTK